jgi:hypothetical protein
VNKIAFVLLLSSCNQELRATEPNSHLACQDHGGVKESEVSENSVWTLCSDGTQIETVFRK